MKRLKDPIYIAAISGICGNTVKTVLELALKRAGWLQVDGREKAAGMTIPPYDVKTALGQAVGAIGDFVIAGTGALATVYLLKFTGTRKPALKGAMIGQGIWTVMYGGMTSLGATKVQAVPPLTSLCEAFVHSAYGAVAAATAVAIADPSVFQPVVRVQPVSNADGTASSDGHQESVASRMGQA